MFACSFVDDSSCGRELPRGHPGNHFTSAVSALTPRDPRRVFPNMDGRHIRNAIFWDIWTRCLQDCRIHHRGIYALKDTFVTATRSRSVCCLCTGRRKNAGRRLMAQGPGVA